MYNSNFNSGTTWHMKSDKCTAVCQSFLKYGVNQIVEPRIFINHTEFVSSSTITSNTKYDGFRGQDTFHSRDLMLSTLRAHFKWNLIVYWSELPWRCPESVLKHLKCDLATRCGCIPLKIKQNMVLKCMKWAERVSNTHIFICNVLAMVCTL